MPAYSGKGDSTGIRTSTVEPDTRIRSGARATGDAPAGEPAGMRPITRKERPRPGAQLHPTATYGTRLTAPATNTKHTPATRLKLRHSRQARTEADLSESLFTHAHPVYDTRYRHGVRCCLL